MKKEVTVSVLFAWILSLTAAAWAAPVAAAPAPVETNSAAGTPLKVKTIAVDVNKDGKPDRTEYYGENDILTKIEADTNNDGKPDEWGTVENGKLVKVAKDSDLDGIADKWVPY